MSTSHDNLATATAGDIVARLLASARDFEIASCDSCLAEAFRRFEPTILVQQVLGPTLREAGQMWHDGKLSVVQEHLLSAAVRHQLFTALDRLNRSAAGPLIAFTTLSGERHEMGSLMCALVASGKGFRCVYLGPDLPVEEVGRFCAHVRVAVVAVSIVTRPAVIDAAGQLQALRGQLPAGVEIWVGGVAAEHLAGDALPPGTIILQQDFAEFLKRLDTLGKEHGMTRRNLLILVVAILMSAAAFALWRPKPAPMVRVEQRDVVELVVATGKLRAVRESVVGAEASGLVESMEVSEGAAVHKGQILGRLRLGETDARLTQTKAALDAADQTLRAEEAALEKAQTDLQRNRELEARRLISRAEVERSASDVAVQAAKTAAARAKLREARSDIDRVVPEFTKREVRAPFDGVVVKRLVEPGTSVNSGQGWFSVAEMGSTEIYVETDENNLGKLKVGQDAIAVSPAFADRPFPARLTQIGPNVDYDRGVVGLRLAPTQLPSFALPNMTVDVNIEVRRADKAMALPVSAVALNDPAPYVLVLEADGHLARKPVRIIGRNPEWAAITGLDPATQVVSEVTAFREGARVRPVTAAGPDGARARPVAVARP